MALQLRMQRTLLHQHTLNTMPYTSSSPHLIPLKTFLLQTPPWDRPKH